MPVIRTAALNCYGCDNSYIRYYNFAYFIVEWWKSAIHCTVVHVWTCHTALMAAYLATNIMFSTV